MEQIGYSLVDGSGNEVDYWGNTLGVIPGIPNPLRLPSGDDVHGLSSTGPVGDYTLVPRYLQAGTPESIAFDGSIVIVTRLVTVAVPALVQMWQAKAALAGLGKIDDASAAIAASGNIPLQLAWEYASTISRASAAVSSIGQVLGLLEADIEYDTLVQVMDRVRIEEQIEDAAIVRSDLFPDISIGDAPVQPEGA